MLDQAIQVRGNVSSQFLTALLLAPLAVPLSLLGRQVARLAKPEADKGLAESEVGYMVEDAQRAGEIAPELTRLADAVQISTHPDGGTEVRMTFTVERRGEPHRARSASSPP